jgi:hypothetical protein
MAKLDTAKEEIGHLKLWEGVFAAAEIGVFGWGIANIEHASLALLWAAIAGLLALTAAIMVLFQRITREIESLKDL